MLTRETVRNLRENLNAKLAALGNELGLSLKLGNCTYGMANATFKLEVAPLNSDGSPPVTKESDDFMMHARSFGLQPTDLDKSFSEGGYTFTVVGLKPRSHRYPVVCRRKDGKMFKFPADRVQRALGGSPTPQSQPTPKGNLRVVDPTKEGDWDLIVKVCHWSHQTVLDPKVAKEAYEEAWKYTDAYGSVGFVPEQGYDWSGFRDSSTESQKKSADAIRGVLAKYGITAFVAINKV